MNKKLLFAAMSFAALTACSTDDFESQQQVAEGVSPIQFEVINNSETTRASMDGNSLVWDVNDGDLFTLYHGVTGTLTSPFALTGYENATYKAVKTDGVATLTTPSMIKEGRAIMVWPVDTTFYAATSGNLTVKIPEVLTNIENNIPYASDLITIKSRVDAATPATYHIGDPNTAGYNRKYPVYMRPMASQLILKADYAGSDAALNALTTGSDPIDAIALTSVDIIDPNTTPSLTKEIDLNFKTPASYTPAIGTNWATVENNAWTEVTGFDRTSAVGAAQLSSKCINGIESAKFLMLPTKTDIGAGGLTGASVVVNTTYGKVTIVQGTTPTTYTAAEIKDAWYRYAAPGAGAGIYTEEETTTAGTGSDASKVRYTNNIEKGLAQVLDAFSNNKTTKTTSLVVGEPTGAVGTRYVKVLLSKLDMDGLHVKTDKQLYDAVRVWKEIGSGDVTVNLDGVATTGEFKISQKTIAKINEINAALAEETTPRSFSVKPCQDAGEVCSTIVITGGGAIAADLTFIKANGTTTAAVALNEGESWQWAASTTAKKIVTVDATATGISSFINRGTLTSNATATLAVYDNNATTPVQLNIPFVNDGTWDVTAGDLTVQFDVTNNGTVNITQNAEYHQDIVGTSATTFTNEALSVPARFFMKDPSKTDEQKAAFVEQIGKVNNSGVFAVTGTSTVKGVINNYGRIEHMLATAKTYVTTNQQGHTVTAPATSPDFASAFDATSGSENKYGLINLPYAIRSSANNVSVSSALNQGFISLTYTGTANTGELSGNFGNKVNYVIVESGIATVGELDPNIKYLEINEPGTEIVFTKSTSTSKNKFDGLMVLSNVNVQQGVTLTISKATFLAAKMYVGGTFNEGSWDGYYGATTSNYTSKYMTY